MKIARTCCCQADCICNETIALYDNLVQSAKSNDKADLTTYIMRALFTQPLHGYSNSQQNDQHEIFRHH